IAFINSGDAPKHIEAGRQARAAARTMNKPVLKIYGLLKVIPGETGEEAQARLDHFNAGVDVECIEDIARGYNMNPNIDQVSPLSKRYAGGERNSISDPLVGSYDALATRIADIVVDSDLDGIILIVPDYVKDLQSIAKRTLVAMREHGVICGGLA